MKCTACGAALPANSLVCTFCGTRNAVDLRSLSASTASAPESPRCCPECGTVMASVDVGHRKRFFIEQCARCHGLFFDLNELQALLEDAVTPVYEVNLPLLDALQKESTVSRRGLTYISCPVCGRMMNRVNFGSRSGVVLDQCRNHGVWLEGGELRRLLEWKKAGGQVLDRRSMESDARAALLRIVGENHSSPEGLRSLAEWFRLTGGV